MNIGDIVKVFSSTSDYDGHTGRVIYISHAAGVPAPFIVQFGDAISEPFSERELVSMKPIEPLWREHPLETHHAPHGASTRVQMHLGRIIASRFLRSERRQLVRWLPDPSPPKYGLSKSVVIPKVDHVAIVDKPVDLHCVDSQGRYLTLGMTLGSPCVQCGKLLCSHR